MSTCSSLSARQKAFIETLAEMLAAWAMPQHAARLYGYLQLQNEAVSLDRIAADLGMSRTYAFKAAQALEGQGNAIRVTEPGSKRILFVASSEFGVTLHRQIETLGRMAALIRRDRSSVASGTAAKRLARLSAFHEALRDAMDDAIRNAAED